MSYLDSSTSTHYGRLIASISLIFAAATTWAILIAHSPRAYATTCSNRATSARLAPSVY